MTDNIYDFDYNIKFLYVKANIGFNYKCMNGKFINQCMNGKLEHINSLIYETLALSSVGHNAKILNSEFNVR